MLNIAICDNDIHVCDELEKVLYGIQERYGEQYHCESYKDSTQFLERLKRDKKLGMDIGQKETTGFDVILLDIEMPEVSGIDVARFIRDEMKDDDVIIVFISSYTAYAMQLFEVHPLDFIVKPVSHENVSHLFEKIYRIMGMGREFFSFKYNREQNRVRISNILYFESLSRKIIIHTVDTEYYFYGKVSELLEDSRLYTFIQVHKSILVNYKYIARVRNDVIVMTNGDILPISQHYRKTVMKRFLEMENH